MIHFRKLLRASLWIFFMSVFLGCGQKEIVRQPIEAESTLNLSQYVIGPEDVLDINVWREQALSGKVLVRADGKISLPLLNDVQAAGLTPLQLQEKLIERLKEFVDSPNVSVIVLEPNSFKIFVSGQVKTPGVYRLRSEATLLDIIPMAGGFSDWANPKKIMVIRKEKGEENRIVVNYNKMVEGKAPALFLKPGDHIVVP